MSATKYKVIAEKFEHVSNNQGTERESKLTKEKETEIAQ